MVAWGACDMSPHPLLNQKAPTFMLPAISGQDVTITPNATFSVDTI